MINRIRKIIFFLFRKTIPIHWIDSFIKKEELDLYAKNCVLGENARIVQDARIINFQNKPENISIGANSLIRGELMLHKYAGKITIGDYTFVGESSRIWSGDEIRIGNNVQISHNVNIMDCNTHSLNDVERHNEYLEILKYGNIQQCGNIASAPIVIEDNVWISFNSSILKGVTIGKGAIVAAHSLVTKDVEPYTMVGGCPAKKIKSLE